MPVSDHLALHVHMEGLIAELAVVSCPLERDQIARELHEAVDRLRALAALRSNPATES